MRGTGWQHESIIVRPDTGPLVAIDAEVLGYLALVPMWPNGEYDGDGNQTVVFDRLLLPPVWAIVHLPTQQVMAFSLTHDDARRFCQEALALGDFWDFCYYRFGYPNRLDRDTTMRRYQEFYNRPEIRRLVY